MERAEIIIVFFWSAAALLGGLGWLLDSVFLIAGGFVLIAFGLGFYTALNRMHKKVCGRPISGDSEYTALRDLLN